MHRPPIRATVLTAAAAVLLSILALTGTTAPAGAQALCTLRQTTGLDDTTTALNINEIDWSGDGRWAALTSNSDPVGGNPDGNVELFLVDTTTGTFQQVTDTTVGYSLSPSLDRDGSRVAFVSDRSLTGQNGDNNTEIFLYDADTDGFTQLTNTTSEQGMNLPSLNGAGTKVAFESTGNLAGSNPDNTTEIFVHTIGGATTALTAGEVGFFSRGPAMSDDGTHVAFSSNVDVVGDNADSNQEIFVRALSQSTPIQVTTTTGGVAGSVRAALDADGSVVAFVSDRDLDANQNPDGNAETYVSTVGSGVFDQLSVTTTTSGGPVTPSVNADGTRVGYRANGDPAGTNPDSSAELWLRDLAEVLPQQLTHSTDVSSNSGVDVDLGGSASFASLTDPLGQNPNNRRRLFRLSCSPSGPAFTDVGPTHPFVDEIGWMAAAGISTGFQPGPTYKPGAAVSRQAMSAFMYRLAGSPPFGDPAQATFGDVSPTNPFFTEIEWMADEGITTGTPASPKPLYKPSSPVSRGAMSAFMYRLAGQPTFTPPGTTTFGDVSGSHPFFLEVEWMAFEDITTGTPASPKPLYKPASAVSRGAMSAFMFRLADGPGVDLTTG